MADSTEGPPPYSPIAICGMGMRLPGNISNDADLWEFLISGGDARTEVPPTRWDAKSFHSKGPNSGTTLSQHGYFLENKDLGSFDKDAFPSISRKEAEQLDPQQRVLMEVVQECFENAGETNWQGKNIACFVGSFADDYVDLQGKDPLYTGFYRLTGSLDFAVANRISYQYDLRGPSVTVRTACSSSLTALHQACGALQRGEVDAALVCGVNLITSPTMSIALNDQGVLSPDGSCRTFDAAANGYSRGEAITSILIKRLDTALDQGSPIRSVIRATSVNYDGKGSSLGSPNPVAQEALIRQAYQSAGLDDFTQTAFVECHGTGTRAGDPLELVAIGNVFGDAGVYIGSVKPNLGHSEAASGLTSLIKSVLALEHKTVPPNIKFDNPNPHIDFKSGRLKVPTQPIPWPQDREARISINSFGFGGSNAHVILDSSEFSRSTGRKATNGFSKASGPQLLVFSASHEASLRRSIENYEQYMLKSSSSLHDLAYTLSSRREHLMHRAFYVTDDKTKALNVSRPTKISRDDPQLVFVFTGQGAQWARMGAELLDDYPIVRASFAKMEDALATLAEPCPWNLREELFKAEEDSLVQNAAYSQPLCTALQCAVVDLLQSLGIRAKAIVGHSSGEIAAAYAAGALSLHDAIIVAYQRGLCSQSIKRSGAMAAIGLGREEAERFLRPGVGIACENSPESTTISGDADALDLVVADIKAAQPETFARRLRIEKAYHSHHVRDVADAYWNTIRDIQPRDPIIPFYSSLYAKEIHHGCEFGPDYWRLNGESTVLFSPAVTAIVKSNPQPKMFLEIGPHGALAGPLRQIMKAMKTPFQYASTVQRNTNGTHSFLEGLGNLYLRDIPVDFSKLHHGRKVLTDLPTYPWNYSGTSFWSEPRMSKEWRLQKHPRHDLLGSRVTATNKLEPSWRNLLTTDSVPWIRDHVVQGNIVFPFVGYLSMAAAAVQQVTEVRGPVTLRQIVVRQALVMYEERGVELFTTFRRLRLTDTLNSDWWEFTIASLAQDGEAWTSHCSGEIRVSESTGSSSSAVASLPRPVDSDYWYTIMARAGLAYGPEFRGLDDISTDPSANKAQCSVPYIDRSQESPYHVHPCELDKCLQSVFLAKSRGLGRHFPNAMVPTTIDEIVLGQQNGNLRLETSAVLEAGRGDVIGQVTGYDQGRIVLQIKGLRASALGGTEKEDSNAGGRVRWMPDIRCLDLTKLVRPQPDRRDLLIDLERLSLLYIVDLATRLKSSKCPTGYLAKHFHWILNKHELIKNGQSDVVPNCQSLVELSEEARRSSIKTLEATLANSVVQAPAAAVSRAFEIAEDVYAHKAEAVEGLFRDDRLADLYRFMDFRYCRDFFRCLAHSRPNMRILEIGAGTGGATRVVLENLLSSSGEQMYNSYTFTDISPGFFNAAKDKLQQYPAIKYQVLDISQDPVEQGFVEGEYDLIIAANCLHATPSLEKTLRHARKLMKPDGYLFLQELSLQTTWMSAIGGLLEGWWLGEEDGREEQPYIHTDRWEKELQNVGFRGLELAAHDHEKPYQVNVCLVATPTIESKPSKSVTLLSNEFDTVWKAAVEVFTKGGYEVQSSRLEEYIPSNDAVVSLLDLEEPFFYNLSSSKLRTMQTFLNKCESSNIIWAMKGSEIDCKDPRHAMALGAIRSLRGELHLPITTIQLEDTQSLHSLVEVLDVQQRQTVSEVLDPDFEFSVHKGLVMIPRILPVSIAEELFGDESLDNDRIELQAGNGSIDTLSWVATRSKPCGELDIEIDVKSVGLNFKDMLLAMFIVRDSKNEMGLEGAGVVRNVGSKVTGMKPGDRVMFYAGGAFTSRISVYKDQCVKIPDTLSFEEAATLPCAFGTTVHSLLELGGLQKGQSVLIHSACGGIGLAAIQLCQMIGADIFATVGSDEKVRYLERNFGISRDKIFNSRDASFLDDVLRVTNGRGVDLVLNSLSGELLHASWKCVAKFGRMVEIGKRDFQGNAKLQMSLFEGNRSFFGVDLHEIAAQAPHILARLLAKTMELYESGLIHPITPISLFEASDVQLGVRQIQQGKHIGKIVIRMQEEAPPVAKKPRQLTLDAHSAYLLVGGMGGLGRAVSTWLVERGARHFIFLSRSASQGSPFVEELKSQGCTVQVFSGSITNRDDVTNAVKGATAPIKGVINLSMVLQDRAFVDMTHEEWETVVSPRVQGTYVLHEALKDSPLDWFVLFGSFCGTIGQWNQSNYAAANTFLDAFVQYRHSLGLPASVMDIGVVKDHGYVSRSATIMTNFKNWGAQAIEEQDLLDALQLSIESSMPAKVPSKGSFLESVEFVEPSQLIIGLKTSKALSDPSIRVRWRRDRRMSIYHNDSLGNVQGQSKADNAQLTTLLKNASEDPAILEEAQSVQDLTQAIGLKIYDLMLLAPEELDTSANLADIGVDSLIVMEILNWWKTTFKFSVSTLEFLSCTSINGVGRLAINGLQKIEMNGRK